MFKVDMHVHTKEISPCSKVYAKRFVMEYKKAGYDGIVICDHFNRKILSLLEGVRWKTKIKNYLEGYRKAKEAGDEIGLQVYLGMELKTPENNNDFLIYGFDEEFLYNNVNLASKNLDEVKKIVDENNLVMVQAHPYRVICSAVDKSLVHGREVFNGHFNHDSQNNLSEKLLRETGGIATSGSDAHYLCDVGNGGIIFEEKPENIAAALREGKYTLIKTEPQWANILFTHKADENKIKIGKAFYEIDAVAEVLEDGIILRKTSGEEIKEVDGIYTAIRHQIVFGKEHLKKADVHEPIVYIDSEIDEKTKELLAEKSASLAVSLKSDDSAPYKEGMTTYIGFDMVEDNLFIALLMGQTAELRKIEL